MFVIVSYSCVSGLRTYFLNVYRDIIVSSQFSSQFGGIGTLAVTVGRGFELIPKVIGGLYNEVTAVEADGNTVGIADTIVDIADNAVVVDVAVAAIR